MTTYRRNHSTGEWDRILAEVRADGVPDVVFERFVEEVGDIRRTYNEAQALLKEIERDVRRRQARIRTVAWGLAALLAVASAIYLSLLFL